MTAIKPVLDLYVNANLFLLLAFGLWIIAQAVMRRSALRHDYSRQLALLKSVLLLTLFSPFLSQGLVWLSQSVSASTPWTLSDIAVAAYLRGDIALPASDFEALLNTRSRVVEGLGTWLWLALGGFAGVFAMLTVRMIRSFWQVRSAVQGSFVWRRIGHVEIRVSDTVGIPFAARGFTRRYVVLPSSLMLHPDELKIVLAHEFQHLRTGDVEWEIAFEVLRPLFFWNPVFLLWKRAFDHLRELSCDQEVLATQRTSAREYAECLINFCERRLSGASPRVMNVAFVRPQVGRSRRALEARVMALSRGKRADGCGVILPGAIFLLAFGLSFAAASVRQAEDWSHDRLMLSTIVNLERLEARNRGE